MDGKEHGNYSLEELASLSGYSRRTIRYYIAEGILSGPVTMGRGAEYTEEHLQRLQAIGKLQGEGRTIPEIRRIFEMSNEVTQKFRQVMDSGSTVFDPGGNSKASLSITWGDVPSTEYVRVQIRVDAPEVVKERIAQALVDIADALKGTNKENEDA